MNSVKKGGEGTPVTVCSTVLEDGALVEMVYQVESGRTALVEWRDGQPVDRDAVDLPDGRRAVPYSASNNLLTHRVVLLPSAIGDYDSETALLEEVSSFIHRYVDVSPTFEQVAAHYALFTWIYDAFKEVPYLRVRGDFGSGKSRFLLTVGALCYKPIMASGASTISPLFRTLDAFRGTLVLDESDFRLSDERVEIVKILNNGNAAGFPVLRSELTPAREYNPRAFHVFGPKIIASRRNFTDTALESRCITEELDGHRLRSEIPLNLPDSFDGEATALRNKLLRFRFQNVHKARDLNALRGGGLEPRIVQIFSPLLATIEDKAARDTLAALAQRYSAMLSAERQSGLESQLLEVIWGLRLAGSPLAVKDIAERFAEQFGSDFRRPVTARWIGSLLRGRLSLMPVKSHGVFVIPASEDVKLRKLFERYEVGKAPTEEF